MSLDFYFQSASATALNTTSSTFLKLGTKSVFGRCGERTYGLIGRVEVKVYNVADASLQHDILVVGVHEAHELGVLQGVQQQLGDARLVLLGSHMHHIVPAALLCPETKQKTGEQRTLMS